MSDEMARANREDTQTQHLCREARHAINARLQDGNRLGHDAEVTLREAARELKATEDQIVAAWN